MSETDYISSVHNYCDRWCERCRFVDRCAVGSSEKLLETELKMELATSEKEKNEILVEHLADTFAESMMMLEKMIEEAGLDVEEVKREAREMPLPKTKLTQRQEELDALAKDYGMKTHNWTKNHSEIFEEETFTKRVLIQSDELEKFIRKIKGALEIVGFYSFFIEAKTNRACNGKEKKWFFQDAKQSDANGSAKIALIAIGKSIKAWEFLMDAFPEIENTILDYLAHLQKISRGLLIEFPDAQKFIRPGFDEEKYDHIR